MAKKKAAETKTVTVAGKPSAILDTRVIYCGDNLDRCVELLQQQTKVSCEEKMASWSEA